MSISRDILAAAVRDAETSPAPFGPRTWTWTVRDDGLELRLPAHLAGRDDTEGRRALLGCGAALHHACVSLAAAGVITGVRRLPPNGDPRLVARVWPVDRQPPRAGDRRLHRAMRPAANEPARATSCSERVAAAISAATIAAGSHLYRVPDDLLSVVPAVVEPGPVFVLHGDSDCRYDWLRAGQALSAAVLTAAAEGLTVDTIDVGPAATHLRAIIPGGGFAYVAFRCHLAVDHDDTIRELVRP